MSSWPQINLIFQQLAFYSLICNLFLSLDSYFYNVRNYLCSDPLVPNMGSKMYARWINIYLLYRNNYTLKGSGLKKRRNIVSSYLHLQMRMDSELGSFETLLFLEAFCIGMCSAVEPFVQPVAQPGKLIPPYLVLPLAVWVPQLCWKMNTKGGGDSTFVWTSPKNYFHNIDHWVLLETRLYSGMDTKQKNQWGSVKVILEVDCQRNLNSCELSSQRSKKKS